MNAVVAPIPIGSRLVDTVAALTPAQLAAFKVGGIDGVIAYLGGNLTQTLLGAALAAGLGVCPVNFSRGETWIPSAALGAQDAAASATRLDVLGVPVEGLVDWCDLEGCGADPTAYLHAWAAQLLGDKKGRLAGLYVGAGGLLSGAQLYALPGFTRYWRSLSRGIPEPQCGFCMSQLFPTTTFNGVGIDYDFADRDFEGRAPTWLKAA